MKLVIVESPSKAKTIEKYLGKDYRVKSSIGHIRDLPKSNKNAIDIEGGFIPHYVISPDKRKLIDNLVKEAKKAELVILATDPDREGEAIAWHLKEVIQEKLKGEKINFQRVSFHEITESVVKEAMQKAREIDLKLKEAQEARRVLDRLFGYGLSGLIWKKVRYGLSAGRVQSPALRILMEREREIRKFKAKAYYILEGQFKNTTGEVFTLQCSQDFSSLEEALNIIHEAEQSTWYIQDIKESQSTRKAKAPFTTSSLQQAASSQLSFSPSRTMRAAQKLYQTGHISYMRTDSTQLSDTAIKEIARFIQKKFGGDYLELKQYKTKSKNAQEAHEAIRPTKFDDKIYGSTEDEKRLYQLIKERTIASQMKSAKLKRKKLIAGIKEKDNFPSFVAHGVELIFPGWLAMDTRSRGEDVELPPVSKGEEISLITLNNTEKFTTPPHRYTEAGLIKELEQRGIGRPSTYASIIRTLVERAYVTREGRTLFPTDTGDVVSSFLEKYFEKYISDSFTAEMEDHLDKIAQGTDKYEKVLADFWYPFARELEAKENIPKLTNLGKAEEQYRCPKCGGDMVYKLGKTGKFISCAKYPDCDGALTLEGKEIGVGLPLGKDPKSGKNVYLLEGRFGPYVQLGESVEIPKLTKYPKGHKKTAAEKEKIKQEKEAREKAKSMPKPRRASIPKNMDPKEITLEKALHLLALPRELGKHPETGEMIIANTGRFGPYVGYGREFRSIKKSTGLDPYTISFEEALKILSEEKALPRGVKLVKKLGKNPKTGKELKLLQSKSGYFIQKGMKRLYLDEKQDPEKFSLEDALKLIDAS